MEDGEISESDEVSVDSMRPFGADSKPASVIAEEKQTDSFALKRKWVGCCSISDFDVGDLVGEGTFGCVFMSIYSISQSLFL